MHHFEILVLSAQQDACANAQCFQESDNFQNRRYTNMAAEDDDELECAPWQSLYLIAFRCITMYTDDQVDIILIISGT